ncbi:DUF4013 domain-containing protein [Kaistella flava (ex Peng et al. 2021)]|uniref:DUF4013 domain-containing protein n=1 Tax=Kaistella flava (ex Peng et al. 2021) TaxID=2038776 RepID=A0A7M2YBG0_9FLAO|nr:DUF4013 domain-containing protein [Kaistella flava (ex Peng et al. 2021)]QOW10752.1 DUF4013 domain-containing protein [Kaistella flava (ex Peng et al. 2021)]
MMQFYQKRDFGAFISDTFAFFKEHGKNYFKNYLLINGILLILMVIIFVFGYREIFSQMMGSNTSGQNYYFEAYFQENSVMLILVSTIVFILFLAVTMISYSYPILYLKRLTETGNKNIKADEILSDLKNNIGRFLKLFLGLFFIVTPLAMIVFGLSVVLMFILIGFFLLILLGPALVNVVNFLMFDYFNTNKGFFESLSYAVRAQFSYKNGREKSPFWKYWGSTIVMYFIIQTITSIFTMIPMMFIFGGILTVPETGEFQQNPFEGSMGIVFFLFYGFSLLLSFMMINLIFVNSGLQYYDSRTDLHRNVDLSEIDTIGTHEI